MGAMGRYIRLCLLGLCLTVVGCQEQSKAVARAVGHTEQTVTLEVQQVEAEASTEIIPAILAVEEILQEALPPPLKPKWTPHIPTAQHIARWEITSRTTYDRKYQGIICPPGASGPTWAIGYDGGHQTKRTILKDWGYRPDASRLATTSGMTGPTRCKNSRATLLDIRVPYTEAFNVFSNVSLYEWEQVTRRIYPGVEELGPYVVGALTGNTYNRGASMSGQRARHKVHIRDVCIKKLKSAACIAEQLIKSCEIWVYETAYKGLCNRRKDEASFAMRAV